MKETMTITKKRENDNDNDDHNNDDYRIMMPMLLILLILERSLLLMFVSPRSNLASCSFVVAPYFVRCSEGVYDRVLKKRILNGIATKVYLLVCC